MSKQAMPMSLVIIRKQIEGYLTDISDLLPLGYKITFVAVTDKPNQEIILTENYLPDIAKLLLEHGEQPPKQESN